MGTLNAIATPTKMATREDFQIVERYDDAVGGLSDDAVQRIDAALLKSFKQLERELTRSYEANRGNTDLLPRQRQLLILDQVREYLTLLNPSQQSAIEADMAEVIAAAYRNGFDMASELLAAATNEETKLFSVVPIDAVAAQARDGMQRLNRHTQDFASRSSAIVEQGLVLGWGAKKVAREMRSQLGTTRSKAESIARTEVMSAQNTASLDRYKRSNIRYIQWMSTPSDAICKICSYRHLKIYKIDEAVIPSHVRCRCIPISYDPLFPRDLEYEKQSTERIYREAEAAGVTPSNVVSPFERSRGLTKAPTPVDTTTIPKTVKKPIVAQPPQPEPPPPPKVKEVVPTFTAQTYNPNANPSLTTKDFRRFLDVRDRLKIQDDPIEAHNQTFDDWKRSTDQSTKTKSRYQSLIARAIDDGYIPSDDAIASIKLKAAQQKKLEQNRADIDSARLEVERMNRAIKHPLMSDADAKGYKPRLTREEAIAYTEGTFMAGIDFSHGNKKRVTDSVQNDGAQPERNTRGIYGQGFYMGAADEIGEEYGADSAQGDGRAEVLTLVAKVKNPYITTIAELDEIGEDLERFEKAMTATTEFIRAKGHDSVYIQDAGYMIVFDGRQVVVHTSRDISDGTELQEQTVKRVNARTGGDEYLEYVAKTKYGDRLNTLEKTK